MYALILAGGSGARLWPHSRRARPKQFLRLTTERTMLQETIDRILPLIPPERIFVATGIPYADVVSDQLPQVPRANILIEPAARGTAPCIGLAALHLRRRDAQAVMAVLSADHQIAHADVLREVLATGDQIAQQGQLVTIGIEPAEPSTAYGYIARGALLEQPGRHQAYRVAAFVEKPDRDRARAYLADGGYYWNAGMFIWRADRILEELATHHPTLATALDEIDAALGTPNAQAVLETSWRTVEELAIDVAVMERTAHAVVIPAQLGWSDVGDWTALAATMAQDSAGNTVVGAHVGMDTRNSLIYGYGRVITTVGVEDLLIVDTDDALLICTRDRAQDIKAVVAQLREHYTRVT